MLISQAALLAYSGYVHSPVYDETGHLAAGASWWLLGRTDVYPHNPPLVKLVAGAPVVLAGARWNWDAVDEHPLRRPEFELGRAFVSGNGFRSFWLFTLARWSCIPFATLGGLIVYRWSAELFGRVAGLGSLALWCFGPNVLAAGQLIVPDCAAASLMAAAAYAFRGWLVWPSWSRAALAGSLLGIANLAKFTAVVLFPLWLLIAAAALAFAFFGQRNRATRAAGADRQPDELLAPAAPAALRVAGRWDRSFPLQAGAILLIGALTINLGYGFQGSFTPLQNYRFHSQILSGEQWADQYFGPGDNRFQAKWWGSIPIPLPRDYVRGIDLQKYDFDAEFVAYLRGQWKKGGWWYYYLYALAIKVPAGTLLLLGLALAGAHWRKLSEAEAIEFACLLGPPLVVLVLVSSQTGINLFLRYVLPALPFLAIAAGAALSPNRSNWQRWVAAGCVGWASLSSLSQFPHSISYFNELVGGPEHGHKHLLDGNIGWGQDLLFLKDWIDAHPEARPLGLVYFGNLDARAAGIDFFLPPRGPMSPNCPCPFIDEQQGPIPGWFAVDVSFAHGLNRQVFDEKGDWQAPPPVCDFSYFSRFEPFDRVGGSLWIYRISLAEANRVRRELGLRELSPRPVE